MCCNHVNYKRIYQERMMDSLSEMYPLRFGIEHDIQKLNSSLARRFTLHGNSVLDFVFFTFHRSGGRKVNYIK